MIYYKKYYNSHFSSQDIYNFHYSKESQLIADSMEFPPTFLSETEDAYSMKILVPGLEAKHFSLKLRENQLVFKGEFKMGKCRFLHKERPSHAFERVYEFTSCIQKEGIESELKNGILCILLPKEKSTEVEIIPKDHSITS